MGIAGKRRKPARKLPTRAIGWGLLAGLVVVAGCLVAPRGERRNAEGEPTVRVRVLANVPSVDLIIDGTSRTVNATSIHKPTTYGSKTDAVISIAGRRFRGDVTLVPVDRDSFDVVNVISVDDYVAGVVPREAFAKWPIEALKAQAIAARTYAIYQLKTRDDSNRTFDLHADVRSQAYGGVDDEEPSTNQAVEETHGIVLAQGRKGSEKIFCAYFSATCGGLTASGIDVFDDPTPTLKEHVSDGCTEATRYRWPEVVIKKEELTRRIKVWGERNKMSIANMAKIRSIEIAGRNSVGRPSKFWVTDEAGKRFNLDAEQMRNACNADGPKDVQIFSSFFTPVATTDAIRFTDGRGWGHGVGMCQWCAAGWSKRGMKYAEILKKSYPGAVLVKAY
jgi:stage II sporulation protein D